MGKDIRSDITVCIPTLNRYDLLKKCVDSLYDAKLPPKEIVVINNGQQVPLGLVDCRVLSFGKNLGVAASWNWFIENIEFPILICNDDLEFGPNDLLNFNNAAALVLGDLYYAENIAGGNMFSCFMPTRKCIEVVGLFDPLFWPAYFEDNDYFRRMQLNNMKWFPVETELKHVRSATIAKFDPATMDQHHENFRRNKKYYISKWGGEPGHETKILSDLS